EHKEAIAGRLYATLTAVVQSMLVTAVTQGVLAGLGYWASGLGFSVFLGFITGLASFLPLAGPAFVWTGAALYLALPGHRGPAAGYCPFGANTPLPSTASACATISRRTSPAGLISRNAPTPCPAGKQVRSGSASGFQKAMTLRCEEIMSCSGKGRILAGSLSSSAMYG